MRSFPEANTAPSPSVDSVSFDTASSSRVSRIPALDGLRAVSVLLVFIGHMAGTRGAFALTGTLGRIAGFGVDIFFVISGFLITSLLCGELDRYRSISLKAFYIRRILRIFPAFYTYLAVLTLLTLAGIVRVTHLQFLAAVTYTVNLWPRGMGWLIAHLWSLSVEEQFYLLWPSVMAYGMLRGAKTIALATVILCPVLRAVAYSLGVRFTGQFPLVADTLAIGCLLALYRATLHRKQWYLAILQSRLCFLFPVAALLMNSYPAGRVGAPLQSAVNFCIAITIDYLITNSGSRVTVFLNRPSLIYTGMLSYSLYIWQQLFLNRASSCSLNSFPLNVVCAIACALLSYHVIEKPFLRLKTYFARDRRLQQTVEVSAL